MVYFNINHEIEQCSSLVQWIMDMHYAPFRQSAAQM